MFKASSDILNILLNLCYFSCHRASLSSVDVIEIFVDDLIGKNCEHSGAYTRRPAQGMSVRIDIHHLALLEEPAIS